MLNWLTDRSKSRRKAEELYGRVVTAARQRELYSVLNVPDTPEGRFEMVAVMLFLALERLKKAGAEGDGLAQLAIEAFVTDMDDCLREMGVGDLSVPKKVKRAAAAFYERAAAYRTALDAQALDGLCALLDRYIFEGGNAVASAALARHMRAARQVLGGVPTEDVLQGVLTFHPFAAEGVRV